MQHIRLERHNHRLIVTSQDGELGFIDRHDTKHFTAVANLEPKGGFGRGASQEVASLEDAVAFITTHGVAL